MQEVAYQHWHRMLFARFLADNNLLMYDGVAVTIEECDELAPDEGAKSGWELAGKLAARMLPQVFKPGSPVFELTFAPEHQSELERLLKDLPDSVFKASDSLGWVYQFWQADNKERINKSEVKIGADELPAVTQLFTEPYMVSFLLHNSLGAWWATRHPDKPCPVSLDYFRTLEDGTPAAGKFEGWPDSLADFKLLDPCCGSGHFLVAAFLMLVPMRIAAEGLSAKEAVNRVLTENIHGLELDPRCVEIAVFAVALEAWRYPDASGKPLGVREIPAPNVASCGLKVAAKAQDWEALVPDEAPNADYMRQELRQLHASFSDAPLLGSLLDPARSLKNDLATSSFETLTALLRRALATERPATLTNEVDDRWELALSAQGLLEAARLLDGRYELVITNVPYLSRGKQSEKLKDYCERHYDEGKNDLANVFLERCLELSQNGGSGVAQLVMPQNWLYQPRYTRQRKNLIQSFAWNIAAKLGPGAFDGITGEVVTVMLFTLSKRTPRKQAEFSGIDVTKVSTSEEKARALRSQELRQIAQLGLLENPDHVVRLDDVDAGHLLSDYATFSNGIQTGDYARFGRSFWEIAVFGRDWIRQQTTVDATVIYGGCSQVLLWEQGSGALVDYVQEKLGGSTGAWLRGLDVWGKRGIQVSAMGSLPVSLYAGRAFDDNSVVILPKDEGDLGAIWAYCSSAEYPIEVRKVSQSLKVRGPLIDVPFDKDRWQSEFESEYPNGLPNRSSDDPAQWLFHGNLKCSTAPLQVAVARLVGYAWPLELDGENAQSNECITVLASHADKDGIVCIPPVGREASASDRLLNLLADAYGADWSNDVLAQLLTAADHAGKSLETWLRDKFFTQHCALFGNRPFVWHVWDGLRDGFAALVNYHKLDYKTLEALIYTYLGDWISRCQDEDRTNGLQEDGEKTAAAKALKKRLELILAGEAPYDIFVRWKPIEQQPIGWNPDLNDGVRLNIRPFLSVPDVGKKGAGVLRDKPKSLHWEKDRGSDVPSAPWYELGLQYGGKVGDRINDHHLSLEEKQKAREKAK
ncbi:MAG: N-6 DNA methylase [Acidithiobacillus sp.]